VPSLTVTVPVGKPPPGVLARTLTPTEIGWPTTAVAGMLVIVVVVGSGATVMELPGVLEERKLLSPL
jgi:hypothetical protein